MKFISRFCSVLLISAIGLFSSPVNADEKEAENCLREKIWAGYEGGWAVRTATTITLEEEAHRVFLVTLYEGNEYRFMVCGDTDSNDLDIVLHNATGEELARDSDQSREPLVEFKAKETQTYYIAVYASSISEDAEGTGIAFAVTYK